MIAVVTGSTGFIGSHVVDALIAQGATVRALLRPQSNVPRAMSGVEYHRVDVLNARSVAQSEIWNGATHLFHLAGRTTARGLTEFREGNVVPLANILRAVADGRGPRVRAVVVSSQAAGGPAASAHSPRTDGETDTPVEWYGQSKLEAEQVALGFLDRIDLTVLRPPAVYGPRDSAFLPLFRQAAGPIALFATPPENEIELAYVSDVVSAILVSAVNDAAIGQRYTVTGPQSVNWRAIYAEVARQSGAALREVRVPPLAMRAAAMAGDLLGMVTQRTPLINSQKLTLGAQPFWLCNGERIRKELGWTPQVALRQGVRETYLWYIAQGWLRAPRAGAPLHSIERDSTN